MKKFLVKLVILLCVVNTVNSQGIGIPASPNATALIDKSQVNLFTGTPQITMPITTIELNGFNLPIYLTYDASGNKVETISSWIGLGWSLNTGGFITRIVRGIPDDYMGDESINDYRIGRLHHFYAADDVQNFDTELPQSFTKLQELTGRYSGGIPDRIDLEPDKFYYNINGKKGEFYFDNNGEIKEVPSSNIKFTKSYSLNKLSGFILTDEDGTKYSFDIVESSSYCINFDNAYDLVELFLLGMPYFDYSDVTYNSTWFLSKIETRFNEVITYEYEDENYNYDLSFYSTARNCSTDACPEEESEIIDMAMNVAGKRISKISTSNEVVDFKESSDTRRDLPGSKALNSITVSYLHPTVNVIKNWALTHDYFISDQSVAPSSKRLMLKSLFEYNNKEAKPPYTFHYNLNVQLPTRISKAQDIWGYYNGKDDATTLIPKVYVYPDKVEDRYRVLPDVNYTGATFLLNGADRQPIEYYMTANILDRIDNPEGGYIQYTYGAHKYYYDGTEYEGGGLRIEEILVSDGKDFTNNIVKTFNYDDTKTAGINTSGRLFYIPIFAFHLFQKDRDVTGITLLNEYNTDKPTYYKKNTLQTNISSSFFNELNIGYEEVKVTENDKGYTIHEFDIAGAFNCRCSSIDCNDENYCESNIIAIPIDEDANYSFKYIYPGLIKTGFNMYPFPPNPNFSWNRGLLKKQTNYDKNGNPLKEVTYIYEDFYKNGTSPTIIYGLKTGTIYSVAEYNYVGEYHTLPSFIFSKYKIFTEVKKNLSSITEKYYNQLDKTKFVISTKTNTFNSYGQIMSTSVPLSDGTSINTTYKYAYNYYNQPFWCAKPDDNMSAALDRMQFNNIYNFPIETVIRKNNKVIGATLTTFDYDWINKIALVKNLYNLEISTPITNFMDSYIESSGSCSGNFIKDTRYKSQTIYDIYDNGRLKQFHNSNNIYTSYILGYNNTLPIASFENAKSNEIFFDNFEENENWVNWYTWHSGSSYSIDRSHTGIQSLKTNNNSGAEIFFYTPELPVSNSIAKKYRMSCWVYSTGPSAQVLIFYNLGTTPYHYDVVANATNTIVNKWVNLEVEIEVPTNAKSIFARIDNNSNGIVYFDDVSVRPADAIMLTDTYNPLIGITSETDSRNQTNYYKYDDLGRLIVAKDNEENILKKMEYNYSKAYLIAPKNYFLLSYQVGTFQIPVYQNHLNNLSVSDNKDWLNCSLINNGNLITIYVNISTNTSIFNRSATISVSGNANGQTFFENIEIEQDGKTF